MSDAEEGKIPLAGTSMKSGQYLEEPALLTWTTQTPTAPGRYGYRKSRDVRASVVEVELDDDSLSVDDKNSVIAGERSRQLRGRLDWTVAAVEVIFKAAGLCTASIGGCFCTALHRPPTSHHRSLTHRHQSLPPFPHPFPRWRCSRQGGQRILHYALMKFGKCAIEDSARGGAGSSYVHEGECKYGESDVPKM